MKSVSGKEWSELKINQRSIEKISQEHNLNLIISKLIIERKFSESEIYCITNELKIDNIFNKYHDFIEASIIIENSILKGEKILVFGDYDVDGSCSTSLLLNFFKSINHPCEYYIPNRQKDVDYEIIKDKAATNIGAIIYRDPYYKGYSFPLKDGKYEMVKGHTTGNFGNNQVSSIKVMSGFRCILYQHWDWGGINQYGNNRCIEIEGKSIPDLKNSDGSGKYNFKLINPDLV